MFSCLCYELYFWSNHKWKHCATMVRKCTIFLGKFFISNDLSLFYIFRNPNLHWSGILVKRPQKVHYQWCEKQITFSHYGVLVDLIWRECLWLLKWSNDKMYSVKSIKKWDLSFLKLPCRFIAWTHIKKYSSLLHHPPTEWLWK